jgi:hypothetical protein
MASNYGCKSKGSKEDALAGSERGAQCSQITNATENRARRTYQLEMKREREGVRSQMQLQSGDG